MTLVCYKTPFHVTYEDDIAEQKDLEVLTELWHSGVAGHDMELHEFLGMTWEEYQVWVVSPSNFKKGE